MNEQMLQELKEIKKLLQIIANKKEQASVTTDMKSMKLRFEYWKDYISIFILGFVAGCTLYPLGTELWRWLIA